jgi:hypothetical protein
MSNQKRTIGVPMKVTDIDRLERVGAQNQRKVATEARFAILKHIEREEGKPNHERRAK